MRRTKAWFVAFLTILATWPLWHGVVDSQPPATPVTKPIRAPRDYLPPPVESVAVLVGCDVLVGWDVLVGPVVLVGWPGCGGGSVLRGCGGPCWAFNVSWADTVSAAAVCAAAPLTGGPATSLVHGKLQPDKANTIVRKTVRVMIFFFTSSSSPEYFSGWLTNYTPILH